MLFIIVFNYDSLFAGSISTISLTSYDYVCHLYFLDQSDQSVSNFVSFFKEITCCLTDAIFYFICAISFLFQCLVCCTFLVIVVHTFNLSESTSKSNYALQCRIKKSKTYVLIPVCYKSLICCFCLSCHYFWRRLKL